MVRYKAYSIEKYRLKKIASFVCGFPKILDLGYAEVPNPFLNNKSVIGLDVQYKKIPPNYTSTVVGDATKLPAPFKPNTFDAIIAGEILEHLENPIEFLKNCNKTLKQNSIIVISTPNPLSPIELILSIFMSRKYFYDKDHTFLIPQRWLVRIMEIAGFVDIKLYSGGFPFPFLYTIPMLRPFAYQTIAVGRTY